MRAPPPTLLIPLLISMVCTTRLTASASSTEMTADLIVDLKSAMLTNKPIYDCACFEEKLTRRIRRNWFPPKCNQSTKVVVAFKISEAGKTVDIRLEHSSGQGLTDQAALQAIERTELEYIPLEHAKINFSFAFVHGAGIVGPTVIQIPDEEAPPVVYVKSMREVTELGTLRGDCGVHTTTNNQGVVELLKGQQKLAAESFERSSQSAPSYQPAIHNLAIARKQSSK